MAKGMAKKKAKRGRGKLRVVGRGLPRPTLERRRSLDREPTDPEATPISPPRVIKPKADPDPISTTPAGRATGPERRLFRRVPFFRKVQYKFETIEQFKSEMANDISLGGMFIKTDAPEPIGSVIYLEFDLQDGTKILSGYGKVVRVISKPSPPEFEAGMGVEFLRFDDDSMEKIRQLVAERFNRG